MASWLSDPRQLGTTGLTVSPMGLGGAPIGGRLGEVRPGRVLEVVRKFLEQGHDLIDTASRYLGGRAEAELGAALSEVDRSSYTICTKIGPSPFAWPARDSLRRSVEESIARLRCGTLDIALIHDPDDTPPDVLSAELSALADLRDLGLVKAIGVGTEDLETLRRVVELGQVDCVLLANRYTLLDHASAADLLDICAGAGTGVMVGGAFSSGILGTGAVAGARFRYGRPSAEMLETVRRAAAVCSKHGSSLRAAALQFSIGHPAVAAVLVGTANPEHLVQNHDDLTAPVCGELWVDLRDMGLMDTLPRGLEMREVDACCSDNR